MDDGDRYLDIFRRAHADHPACLADTWLTEPCRLEDGTEADRPLVWSRRNGPWTRHDVLFVGAAPGNAGGMGSGSMGAHGTRIPFGGDIAGANLDVLLSSAGLDRNQTFIIAALNQLPERGGGEPRVAELREPVGEIPSSVHLLRETILAVTPRLIVALGNVALRSTVAAARLESRKRLTLPGLERLEAAGLARGEARPWPRDFEPDDAFRAAWAAVAAEESAAEPSGPEEPGPGEPGPGEPGPGEVAARRTRWDGPGTPPAAPAPHLLWLLHPSAQNMSPHAGVDTVFHSRMLETVAALRRAMVEVLGGTPPEQRPRPPDTGIYALPEWRSVIGPRHEELDALWREKGV